jgi:diguanylate cyclase (GGDEF)-like protein
MNMSRLAKLYVGGVLSAGLLVAASTLWQPYSGLNPWVTFGALVTLATFAQLFKAEAPDHQLYYATPLFYFAGLFLLTPPLVVVLVVVPHLVEWVRERLRHGPHLRAWYLQPFNIAMYVIAGQAAFSLFTALWSGAADYSQPACLIAIFVAALTFGILNHGILGLALVLARGVSWRESGVLDIENVTTDLILLCLGSTVAAVWQISPLLISTTLAPLILMYRALKIPQLKHDALTDVKTGLYNAQHFNRALPLEFDKARRFNRPLSVVIADLDLLRNINNIYGHLAGDAVLAAIGQIIRKSIRDNDTAARFGGEEFVILLPDIGPGAALEIAERLRAAVEAARFEVATSSEPIHATLSLGVAHYPADALAPNELLHMADLAVYQAKLQGRNRVALAQEVPDGLKLEGAPSEERLANVYTSGAPAPASRPAVQHVAPAARGAADRMFPTTPSKSRNSLPWSLRN